MSNLTSDKAEFDLEQVMLIMSQLTKWLIHSGIGYTEFSNELKSLFYQQAIAELERIDQKTTISAISLLSGLHRKDVSALKAQQENDEISKYFPQIEPISLPAKVVGLWLAECWGSSLALKKNYENSFESLVKRVSVDVHPKSILNELLRLGVVEIRNDLVILRKNGFIPNPEFQEIRKLFSQNVNSHLASGLHNIFNTDQPSFLEESIRADEITHESLNKLKQHSLKFWNQYSKELLELASKQCASDKGKADANQTFCLGIYQSEI